MEDNVDELYNQLLFNKYNLKEIKEGLDDNNVFVTNYKDVCYFIKDCLYLIYGNNYIIKVKYASDPEDNMYGIIKLKSHTDHIIDAIENSIRFSYDESKFKVISDYENGGNIEFRSIVSESIQSTSDSKWKWIKQNVFLLRLKSYFKNAYNSWLRSIHSRTSETVRRKRIIS